MRRNVTSTARIPILEPSASNVVVLFVNGKFYTFTLLLIFICCGDASDTGADAHQAHLPRLVNSGMSGCVLVAGIMARLIVVAIAIGQRGRFCRARRRHAVEEERQVAGKVE